MAKKKTRTGGGRVEKQRRRAARAGKARASDPGARLPSWPGPDSFGSPVCPGARGVEFDFCGACAGCAAFVDFVEAEWELGFCGACEDCADSARLLDTSRCPVAGTCAGCGETTGLRAVTAAFVTPVPVPVPVIDVACATLCGVCAGSGVSFVRRLGPAGTDHAMARHAEHWSGPVVPVPCPPGPDRFPG